jgi:hypothetical protein
MLAAGSAAPQGGADVQRACDLAIVVPAYKTDFLALTLRSIRAQSDRDFRLYVFDDASPNDVESVARAALDGFPFVFHRFASNVGGRDLAAHWNRCVEKVDSSWVWVFSDDDLMSTDCVAAFRRTLAVAEVPADVYAFPTQFIDDSGVITRHSPPLPPVESSVEFALARLRNDRDSVVPDHVFSRAAFVREGGFRSLPMAWCSDDATWIAFARHTGIHAIRDAVVQWRLGGTNVSGRRGNAAAPKIEACLEYLKWLQTEIAAGRLPSPRAMVLDDLSRLAADWFAGQVRWQGVRPGWSSARSMATTMKSIFGYSAAHTALLTAKIALGARLADLRRWLRRLK